MRKASLLELCHGEKKYKAFSISENNKRMLLYCRAKKMYVMVNKQVKILTAQYIGTCKSAYTKGYALN